MKYSELWTKDRPCPFDSQAGEDKILENNSAYLTYALAPYHQDHLLVVPKRHVEHLAEITDEEMRDIDELEKKGWEMLRKLGYTDVSYVVREGKGSGKTVGHLHYHIIPDVRIGDIDHKEDERQVLTRDEVAATIARLKQVI